MSSVLQQTLRGLCFDTGWCYAVFWKLKRQARPVLTWEDAFYGVKADDISASSLTTTRQGFGQQLNAGLADMEDPIAFSVSKMSYHVYSVGEGIIGRVAFTNKHQWVFSLDDKRTATVGAPIKRANVRVQPEKYPSGWDQQFAAGIKTIAVIAVPQGVVQLGSTRVIAEDLKLTGHVKALFGTLQNVPGAFLSDLVTDVQRGGVQTVYPVAVPVPQLTLATTPSLPSTLGQTPSLPANMNLPTAGVGRLQGLLASQPQILTHAHSMPSPSVLGFVGSVPYFQHAPCDKSMMESLSHASFYALNPSCTWGGVEDIQPVNVGVNVSTTLTAGLIKPPAPSSVASGTKPNTAPRTGVIKHLSLNSKASPMSMPVTTGTDWSLAEGKAVNVEGTKSNPSPRTGVIKHLSLHSKASTMAMLATTGSDSSVTGGKGVIVDESELLKYKPQPRTGFIRHLSLSSKASPIATPAAIDLPKAVHTPYPVNSSATRGKDVFGMSVPAGTGTGSSMTGGEGVNVEESGLMKANPPPQIGGIRHLSLGSTASPIAIPAGIEPPRVVHYPCFVNSSDTRGTSVLVEESVKSRANPLFRTGIIRQLSLNSKFSPVAKPGAAGNSAPQPVHSCYFVDTVASGGKFQAVGSSREESEKLRMQSKPTIKTNTKSVTESYVPVSAEGCDVKSFIQRPESFLSSTKDDCSSVKRRTLSECTQNMGCGTSARPFLVGVQPLAEEPISGSAVVGSSHFVPQCLTSEIPHSIGRHSETSKNLESCRFPSESGQMGLYQTKAGAGLLKWGRRMVDYGQLATVPVGKRLAKGGQQFSNHVNGHSIHNCQSMSLLTEELGVVTQLDKSASTCTQPGDHNLLTCSSSDVFCGLHMAEEKSTSWTLEQDFRGKESRSFNAQVSLPLVKEFTSESSRLTAQMSDLLELAQQFEIADSEGHRDFSSENVDSYQNFSFGLQCDDYFESVQSLKPLLQSPERPAEIDYSVYNLFTSELAEFDEFFASIAKAENGRSDFASQPEAVCDIGSNSQVSTYLDIHSCGVSAKGKETSMHITTEANASQALPDWVATEAILVDKEVANTQKGFQVDRFVRSQVYPEVALPCSRLDGDTDLGCQELAALLPPVSRQLRTRKKAKKRPRPGKVDDVQQSKRRLKVQDQIQELRAIIPNGERCSLDTLLERALEYASALQTVSQDSDNVTPSTKSQTHAGATEMESGSVSTSSNASWVVDIHTEERMCPVLVESLSQPGQMLVEVLCQEPAMFLKVADSVKGLGFIILKGVMEARNNVLWAQFVIMGPKDVQRVQVLWSLMPLIGSSMTT